MSDNRSNPPARHGAAAVLLAAALAVGTTGCSWLGGNRSSAERPTEAVDAADSRAERNPAEPPRRPGRNANTSDLMKQAEQARAEGDAEEAIRLLAAAIERNPTLTVAHIDIGDLYLEQGDPNSAEKHFGTAAQQQPSSFDAQFKHGYALQLLNRLADAVRAYLRALSIQPDDYQANQNLATAYLQLAEPGAALSYAQRAVALRPTSGPARANLGSVLTSLDRHDEAVREYRAAAELMALTPQLLLNLSESLGKLDRHEEMASTLDQLAQTDPSAQGLERLGYARFKLRQFNAARDAFQRAVSIDPTHYPALNGLGVCLLNDYLASNRNLEDARRDALKLLRQSLRLNKNQPKIFELVNRYD
ncbi:MAG: tetratricopeptide repeat protein [Phycisphaerales bacterium]